MLMATVVVVVVAAAAEVPSIDYQRRLRPEWGDQAAFVVDERASILDASVC